ncbi:similar to Saccharomyces cerevisiae YGL241W KAP114 Karyopherin, responsible for nuclear import of Spt15p, Sua7p, histones H2A and H2B, and Nap1p [Maudiozyma saulgeensis]|uniref:Similar to Saccharomyces cerevisiae YGL241W KAP114 Karyopherin, responsible for nuclear import of Spt15p, Sua7p, histones H2A and H2B, and Nap1p n=1 Tax=Maudiozyma saulgeensis TaxID=1789683 RepID=A0A1X7RAQ2_9SACH|nr:similar to Saccharomyces cerevisiae YGL241W KAP114 Karyopherin, responsible for nuclear import of Spt15p, Sua7p, histones H2A and H2B, and Nap1p [Kazachstania saulgeensis]
MNFNIDELIVGAQSADNIQRESAEARLLESCDANSSGIFNALITVALDPGHDISARQFSLLSLRKLITLYWGPGFESYRNTSVVDQVSKTSSRQALLKLCLDDQVDTKIRNSASYCVVQISAVDFPDQWPELLQIVYDAISNHHSLSAMALLNEIYDDVISEEMFFEGGIGYETLSVIFQLLVNENAILDARIAAINLFHSTLLQMSAIESHSTEKRKLFIQECIPRALQTLGGLLTQAIDLSNTKQTTLVGKIYENLVLIKNEFPKKLFPKEYQVSFKTQVFVDLENLKNQYSIYLQPSNVSNNGDALDVVNECGIFMIEFLTSLLTLSMTHEEQTKIIDMSLILCTLDSNTVESWTSDFNEFVSKETGLQASFSIRDQINEYLGSLSEEHLLIHFTILTQKVGSLLANYNDTQSSRLLESSLYIFQNLLMNDDEIQITQTNDLINMINAIFEQNTDDELLKGRIILLIPKLLEKFMDVLPDVKDLVQAYLFKIIELVSTVDNVLLKSCGLISFMSFTYFVELPSVLGDERCVAVQQSILHIVNKIMEDAEEDTYGLLIEAINQVIAINNEVTPSSILEQQFSMVMNISSKDPANVQIVVESQDCLEKLLDGINTTAYESYIQICMPSFVNIIKGSSTISYKYSPLLSLILEFVTVFMKKKPDNFLLPFPIVDYLFDPLVDVLRVSTEEETLQLATDAFSYMIYNAGASVITPRLETVVGVLERLLSLSVSDSAAMNVGTLIVTILTKFSTEIQDLVPVILRAAVNRLINSKNISTQQNLISLLCLLTCSDVKQTLDFLFQLQDESQDPLLVSKVLTKWFESFEVIRGEKKIKENIVALSKLYMSSDPRLTDLHVNGDLIPYDGDLIITRSMAKKMPDRYTQVSPYTKIVKLFVTELGFQTRQPTNQECIESAVGITGSTATNTHKKREDVSNDDDDGWEDVDDVLNYDKLKEYIEDEEEDPAEFGEDDTEEITGLGIIQQNITELLVDSLKQFASTDTNSFGAIYNTLSEQDKATVTQQLL